MVRAAGIFLFCLLLPVKALAQSTALDSDKPIEIDADALEVRQNEKQAIFSGNVIARQGGITMKSARMVVFYEGGKNANESTASNASTNSGGATEISKIQADGGVFFTSAQETARAANALYDVKSEQIYMQGDVTLTRQDNVLKGSHLVYNLKTGKSILTAGGNKQSPDGRVRGLFVPKQDQQ